MNRETPEETGIYLLSSSLPQHCLYTRLSSLQKLKVQPPRYSSLLPLVLFCCVFVYNDQGTCCYLSFVCLFVCRGTKHTTKQEGSQSIEQKLSPQHKNIQ